MWNKVFCIFLSEKNWGFLALYFKLRDLNVHFCFLYSCPFSSCTNRFSLKFPILLHSTIIYLHCFTYLSWDCLHTRCIKFLGLGAPFAPMRLCLKGSDCVGRAAGQPLIYVLYLRHFFLNGFKTLVVDYLRCPVHFYPKMGSCKSSMLLPLQ